MGLRHSVPIHTHFGGCATTRSFVCVCVEDRNAWSFGHSPTLRPCKDHLAVQIGLFGVYIGLCCGHRAILSVRRARLILCWLFGEKVGLF